MVDLKRFREVLSRRPKMTEKLFSPRELADMAPRFDPVPGLAARFCAKEAFLKAVGMGLFACDLKDIEVAKSFSGAPELCLYNKALLLANEIGAARLDLSVSHSDLVATAIVIIS
ncbi:MAG: holo-ACP synthase [Firmicutes bacterium]|nr:holo-ACP synthase [Bacillota bacterium]